MGTSLLEAGLFVCGGGWVVVGGCVRGRYQLKSPEYLALSVNEQCASPPAATTTTILGELQFTPSQLR